MVGSSLSRRAKGASALVLTAAALVACGQSNDADLVAGKQQFVAKCGACHVLGRAQTKGVTGPNLDEAFQQALKDGMGRSGVEGVVHRWILNPSINGPMPAKLVTGKAAEDVAAYVARVVAAPGEDRGLLATAVKQAGDGKPAVARDGELSIESDPTGQLAYVTGRATAEAGRLTVKSPNESTVPHNIVIDDKGKGQVVQGGGVSQFEADFKPGKYQYYCSVQGHREAGMVGELTVE